MSAAGTVLVHFDVMLSATSSTAITNSYYDILGLFIASSPSCATTTPAGCPANSMLVGKLQQYGLPLSAAYYNQQFPVSPPPPTPVAGRRAMY